MSTIEERDGVTGLDLTAAGDTAAPARVGRKAATLARLQGLGFPVPELTAVPAGTPDAAVDAYAAGLAERFAGQRLAVRSSGVSEDGATASFAGQFLTVLDVEASPAALAQAIRQVRASAEEERVRAYAGDDADLSLAVLVMPMIDASAAGVAFTRDPVTGAERVVIEAVSGVADRLVSGEVAGERWTVDGSVAEGDGEVLSADDAVAVAELARRIESHEGAPQDVEWAVDAGGGLYVLQARPITGAAHDAGEVVPIPIVDDVPPGPWMWDSTHSRAPGTPLLASIFPGAMERGSRRTVAEFGLPIDHLRMRSIGGYFHIQVVPPIGAPSDRLPPRPLLWLANRLHPAMRARERTAAVAFAERRADVLRDRWLAEVRPEVEATLRERWNEDPSELDDATLATRLIDAAELQREVFAWNMVTDLAYLQPLHELVAFLRDRGAGGLEEALGLVGGSSPSEYLASLSRVAAVMDDAAVATIGEAGPDVLARLAQRHPAVAAAYEEHRTVFGSRLLGYDYDVPTVGEDPAAELAHAVALRGWDGSTAATRLASELATRIGADLADGARRELDELISEARRTYPVREEGEGVHARAAGLVRTYAVASGHRLVAAGQTRRPEDATLLTLDELTGWLREGGDVTELLARRRGERRWAELHPPRPADPAAARPPDPSVFTPNVARMLELMLLIIEHDAAEVAVAEHVDGVAASAGRHTGPVRIVQTPGQLADVRPGEVLIAPLTTSAWEHVFPVIGALVCEAGGLLSHPAIIAREHGVPAVVGCRDATRRFRDGQLVTVDGSRGTVEPHG